MADQNLSIFNSTLPATVTQIITDYDTLTSTLSLLPSYFNVTINNGGLLNGTYDAWCVNSSFSLSRGTYNNASVYSSYGNIPTGILYTGSQTIDSTPDPYLDKLQQINWILNNITEAANVVNGKYRYDGVDYTSGDIQLAIWMLLGETSILNSTDYNSLKAYSQQNADQLVNLAVANGTNFIPLAGQDFGVIVKAANQQPILMEVKTAGIGDFVWEDLDADGIQDSNESGIDGVTVTLIGKNNTVLGTTITGDNPYTAQVEKGWYQFGPLLPDTYQVRFSLPTGFNAVSPYLQGSNTSSDSNANPDNNLTSASITLAPGEVNTTIDAGFYKLASLGDFVFADNNNNGIQDIGETGVGGVKVELVANGIVIGTTSTNADGSYGFSGLTPGNYQVKFTAPTGYQFSPANQGTDDAKDSDADVTTGLTQSVTLTSGEFNGTLDAGLVALASIGDFVWHDLDADGIQDTNEPGIANAIVKLRKDGVEIATTTTDSAGKYSFSNLTPGGGYQVQFITPGGFTQSSPVDAGGNDSIDSDGTLTGVVSLAPGENNPTLDSGFYKLASLGDFVFNDANNNGIQDIGETGVGGVKVELVANGIVIGTTSTNADGSYGFSGLTPGNYQVKFTAPTGYQFSPANQGTDDAKDSDADVTTGLTQSVTLTSGEFNGTLDAGLVALASIGDFVWHDLDADGIQDTNEPGIANAIVKLRKDGVEIATTTTDSAGKYSFSNLTPGGGYQVQFITPGGFTQSSPVDAGAMTALIVMGR
uniref:SdrD B-like domain-containing protein n=1 Tax=Nostoc sp. CMAA1605 TaxID=2055159 RepID=UPI001F1A7B74|nr:SdrD B-like domain-containing protein [Nostoc sp. CMAA1605]